ncbi:sugar lactone lactonase YvrE [Angulomicrobium tetraedrale]|uniref:Sugar lactone lactonase YvrE n=1 Tax=Ancylobacter tetraedralis TaxID=217068 RepID=A0A839ZCP2_9HYPH|nr:SMP-30/gluconolactonase/LRE family protein [Ancylobacter tetraedralis]MBB3772553.1 sugar lactone lactonase YvrE [Ancylobacter tetraedralis]
MNPSTAAPDWRPAIAIVAQTSDTLGEAPLWHPLDGCLYWLDLAGARLHRMAADGHVTTREVDRPTPLGAIVAGPAPGCLILSALDGLSLYHWANDTLLALCHPEAGRSAIGYNDAKVDRAGRLWIGTSDLAEQEPRGVLWCWTPGSAPVLAEAGFTVVNGPAFSPDGRTLYLSDSVGRRVLAYDVAPDAPVLTHRREFAAMAVDEGYPDGLTVDAQGGVWLAHWDGWRVTRFSPEGERLQVVPLPAPRITSVAFGGEGLATLFVTSARLDLAPPLLDAAPLSGSLFAVDAGVSGLPERPFNPV